MFCRFLAVVLALMSAPLPAGAQSIAGKAPRVGLFGITSGAIWATWRQPSRYSIPRRSAIMRRLNNRR